MTNRRIRAICTWTVGLLTLASCLPSLLAAQEAAGLRMPLVSLRQIALDFDAGRNTIYCYYGAALASGPEIRVDSLQVISTPSECKGVGVGFISRIADKPMIAAMLRGLLVSHPAFRIISAFYGTEQIDVDGQPVRAARALSVLRGTHVRDAAYGT
jgi:hypothetical protein